NRLVAPLAAIDDADASGARFEQPKAILVPARRMRHRQPVHQYLTARYLHEDAAILLVRAPTGGTIGPAQSGDIAWLPVRQAESVQMTAILRGQGSNERWLPAWHEAMQRVAGGQAGK